MRSPSPYEEDKLWIDAYPITQASALAVAPLQRGALWIAVILPSALPFIVAGVRLALGRALVGMVVADLYTAVSGVGYLIVRYAQNLQIDRVLVPVVILSLMGVTLVQALRWLEARVAPWEHYSRDE